MRFARHLRRALTRGFLQTMPIAIAIVVTAAVMDARDTRPAIASNACTVQVLRSEYRMRGAVANLTAMVSNQGKMLADARDIEAEHAKQRAALVTFWGTSVARGE